ncbi:uncharacterized protein I303_101743 [Kwoniella dejecticola CBS 10117]|uniref:Uncharacterized protein n=1 Tax=Kwoniella dejecticola CBS 10117 TaxID=1296121 RepID=A0A1A6ACX2_9TREE|nr:uncharacterized protein I303_02121 [Kwoniella dejecticola CBS 10117]OBR87906.1 hypothetical protein I303_02121 [Kwoniella dejecticola CBS 10117]
MGIFGKAKPAFSPPELPVHEPVPARATQRRVSLFPSLASIGLVEPDADAPIDPVTRGRTFSGEQQRGINGRKLSQAIVPAWHRKASEALARRDTNPENLRLGETTRYNQDGMNNAFYKSKLTIDNGSSEEEDSDGEFAPDRLSVTRKVRRNKGKGKARGSDALPGWEAGPPLKAKVKKGKSKDKKSKNRHRSKRVMRRLDENLDAYNAYAQNGLVPLTRSANATRDETSALNPPPMSIGNTILEEDENMVKSASHTMSLNTAGQTDHPRAVLFGDGFDALDVMADHIFRLGVQKKKWFKAPRMGVRRNDAATGVTIRARTGLYRTFPVDYEALKPFEEAITRLNPEVAIKIKSDIVGTIFDTYINPSPSMNELVIDENTRIQILDSIELLARARKHQYAAFVRSEQVLVVWADAVENVIPAAEALEESLIQFIWQGPEVNVKFNLVMLHDAKNREDEKEQERRDSQNSNEKYGIDGVVLPELTADDKGSVKTKEEDLDPEDIAKREMRRKWRERPVMMIAPVSDGLAIMLLITIISLGIRTLLKEYLLDGKPMRFVLLIFAPGLMCVATFAAMVVINSAGQIFGPVRQVTQNSRYFSGIAPKRTMGELAHVTVKLPVYKESLEEVIMPTVESLKAAITTYERQGGSVGILICDDGLQLLSKAEADKRRRFYFDNNLAYVARPGHGVDGFVRKGRFKKAGNMNYAAALSLRVEEIMDELRPAAAEKLDADHFWNELDENDIYDAALAQALEEKEGKAWAAGNIRIGEIILIVDSDTRVPEDCFADAVSEMKESPEVAIIQHASGVMQVAHHFFENGVAHFTRMIQHAISYCCASGEVAPFVGHNAFLRWSALQECMFVDPDDGVNKIWSEDHVSEDFQIAVTLQIKGYTVRWATYSGSAFEEGVSLTVDDEINRWQKYAFGCSELVFKPIKSWFRGPITPLFHGFVWSDIPIHSKFSICGYIFSYYAISIAWLTTVGNYFIEGFNLPVDGYYLNSWKITLVCLTIFTGLSNLAYIVLRYRLKVPDSSRLAVDQIKWIPYLTIFFTGMSMPLSAATVAHLVGYNMTWSTTVKTVEKSNFFLQLPIIWRRFWPQLSFFGLCVPMMVITSGSLMPAGYRIGSHNIEVFVPMGIITAAHLLYPFALNPWFLSFSF